MAGRAQAGRIGRVGRHRIPREILRHPIKRIGRTALGNVLYDGNSGITDYIHKEDHPDPTPVSDAARWALGRLRDVANGVDQG